MVHEHEDVVGASKTPVVVNLTNIRQTTPIYKAGPTRTGCVVPQPGRRVVHNQVGLYLYLSLDASDCDWLPTLRELAKGDCVCDRVWL
eukprot:1189108-Prorocentrum_minimum.AAC.3